jgi:hypothetical protein
MQWPKDYSAVPNSFHNLCELIAKRMIELSYGYHQSEWVHSWKNGGIFPVIPPIYVLNIWIVSYPGKGECADPVNEDAILEEEGGGETPGRDKERQLASDTGGGKTWISVKWEYGWKTRKTTPSRLRDTSMHRVSQRA